MIDLAQIKIVLPMLSDSFHDRFHHGKATQMNHRHRKILHTLFTHPVSSNINFKDVLHVLSELGAEVDHRSGNRVGVTLNGHMAAFTHVHHDLPKEEVIQMRKFLGACGIDPTTHPL